MEGTPLPILPSRAKGFGGVGKMAFDPKKRSFFELELSAGLMAPSFAGVDFLKSDSRRLSRPSEGALEGCRRMGDGSGEGPFRSQGRSWAYEPVVGDDEEGGDSESRDNRLPSIARRADIVAPLSEDAVCETSMRILGGATGDRDVTGDAAAALEEGPATIPELSY